MTKTGGGTRQVPIIIDGKSVGLIQLNIFPSTRITRGELDELTQRLASASAAQITRYHERRTDDET